MTQNISHSNIYGEDLFKDNVKIKNRVLIVKPIVPLSLVVELVNFIKSICEIIYWDGKDLTCPNCGKKLYRNSYHERLINKIHPVKLQKYICSNKE
ncbi:MAG: Pseudogene of transposase [Methanobrevibacter sp. CfCl-M3]